MSEGIIFSTETAQAALNDILKAIEESDNARKIKEAQESAGNDMIKRMQYVFPIVMMVQMDVIKDYGFPEGRNGIVNFNRLISKMEKEDPEVALLHSRVRAHFLPQVPTTTGASL